MDTRFFNYEEFDCRLLVGSGQKYMDREFLQMLNEARRLAGIKFKIVEGYKSTKRQHFEGGLTNNPHLIGRAAKIWCIHKEKRYKIITSLLEVGFTRVGIERNYVYVDNDDLKKDMIWLE